MAFIQYSGGYDYPSYAVASVLYPYRYHRAGHSCGPLRCNETGKG